MFKVKQLNVHKTDNNQMDGDVEGDDFDEDDDADLEDNDVSPPPPPPDDDDEDDDDMEGDPLLSPMLLLLLWSLCISSCVLCSISISATLRTESSASVVMAEWRELIM